MGRNMQFHRLSACWTLLVYKWYFLFIFRAESGI